MRMRSAAVTSLALLGVAACSRGGSGRSAGPPGLPTSFTPIAWAPSAQSPTGAAPSGAAGECAIRLRDERTGAVLTLMRSELRTETSTRGDTVMTVYRSHGDYSVEPAGTYGVREGQRLRVECGTWKGIGVVPAQP